MLRLCSLICVLLVNPKHKFPQPIDAVLELRSHANLPCLLKLALIVALDQILTVRWMPDHPTFPLSLKAWFRTKAKQVVFKYHQTSLQMPPFQSVPNYVLDKWNNVAESWKCISSRHIQMFTYTDQSNWCMLVSSLLYWKPLFKQLNWNLRFQTNMPTREQGMSELWKAFTQWLGWRCITECSVFPQMYITCSVKAKGTRLAKPVLSLGLMCLAFLTGINRVVEYRNHWSDVIAGFIIGGAIAVFMVRSLLRTHTYSKDTYAAHMHTYMNMHT